MNKKKDFIDYIEAAPRDFTIGVYYLDKMLNILHYNVYKPEDIQVLKEKIKKLSADLEDEFLQVVAWKASPSVDYLVGVYDGLLIEMEKKK